MKVLVTGAAGFIGYSITKHLVDQGHQVVGIDNLNNYYSIDLKKARLKNLGVDVSANTADYQGLNGLKYYMLDIKDEASIDNLFSKYNFEKVIHLSAQAGVRYSLENPRTYVENNVTGFFNIIDACKKHKVEHLLYASSSSVYGMNKEIPFSVDHNVDTPVSLYAATKKSNELFAYTYSHLYGLRTTGMRFFTVYGPWGRPDMAYYLFVDAILKNKTIRVFNNGDLKRDFTYIDDIVSGIDNLVTSSAPYFAEDVPYEIHNLGNNTPVKLMDFIETIEESLGKKATKEYLPMQKGDVYETYANIDSMVEGYNYAPKTSIEEGIEKFVNWYKSYHL